MKESFALPDGELEFEVGYDGSTGRKFAELVRELAPQGYRPELTGSKDQCVLMVRKAVPTPSRASRVTVVMALLTGVSLIVFGFLEQGIDDVLVPSMSVPYVLLGFSGVIGAIMAAHELAQRFVAMGGWAGRANSYLIPGIPFITSFLPSLGFVTTQREPAVSRDALFDVVIAGPLAIVGVSLVFYVVGVFTAVTSAVPFSSTGLANSTVSINPNAIEAAVLAAVGHHLAGAPAGYLLVSPIADGAAFGFVLAFICLLPMAIFDGGLLSNLAWGERAARAATYLSVLLLLVIDVSYAIYWAPAIVALLLAGRPARPRLLDEVSALSNRRRWIFVCALALAALCLPFPHNIATIPLP